MNFNTPQSSENNKATSMSLKEWEDKMVYPNYYKDEPFHFNGNPSTSLSPAHEVNAIFSFSGSLEQAFQNPFWEEADQASFFGSPKNSENSRRPSNLKLDGLADFAKVSTTQGFAKQEGNTLMYDSTNIGNWKSDENSNIDRDSYSYNSISLNQEYSLDNQWVSSRSYGLSLDSKEELFGSNDDPSDYNNDSDDETVKGKKNKRSKQTRWKKVNDRKLLITLESILKQYETTFDQISEAVRQETQNSAVDELVLKTGWKQPAFYLIKRIQKLYKASEALTTREIKNLRKVYYKMIKSNTLNWDEIYYMFPAKNQKMIRKQCESFKRGKNSSQTSSVSHNSTRESSNLDNSTPTHM